MRDVTETAVPIIHTREDRATVRVVKGESRFLVRSSEVNGACAIIEQVIPPEGGPPRHVDRHETEIFYVVEGNFEIEVGGRIAAAPPGASAVCPRDIPQRFRNVSAGPARLLLTIVPGRFGEFFERVDGVDPRTLRRWRERYAAEGATGPADRSSLPCRWNGF